MVMVGGVVHVCVCACARVRECVWERVRACARVYESVLGLTLSLTCILHTYLRPTPLPLPPPQLLGTFMLTESLTLSIPLAHSPSPACPILTEFFIQLLSRSPYPFYLICTLFIGFWVANAASAASNYQHLCFLIQNRVLTQFKRRLTKMQGSMGRRCLSECGMNTTRKTHRARAPEIAADLTSPRLSKRLLPMPRS